MLSFDTKSPEAVLASLPGWVKRELLYYGGADITSADVGVPAARQTLR